MTVPVIPAPARIDAASGSFQIRDGLTVAAATPELAATVQLFVDDVRADTGIALKASADAPGITVTLSEERLDAVAPAGGIRADGAADADERYGLAIAADGIRVWGATVEGIHRALTTLRQLIAADASEDAATLAAVTILDGPRFAWRGLSLDVSRTFHDVDTVRGVIQMCALHKLNVLHLHLTDDQGWRIEIPSRPELTTIGSVGAIGDRPGGFYSVADVADLVAYAAARFITLVPEIDMPGHTGAIFRAYPELAPAGGTGGDASTGLAIGTLDPQRPATWDFVEDVLDSVIAQFPQSAYLHIGGDEAFGMADEEHAAFVERAIDLVRARGKRAVGWQEIARAALSADEVVQYWMDSRAMGEMMGNEALKSMVPAEMMPVIMENLTKAEHDVPQALKAGSKLVISPTTRLYFDSPQGDEVADGAQQELHDRLGLPVYPPLTLAHTVQWDPVEDTPGVTGDEQIAGVEAAIWCETIATREELEFMLLPRLGSVAEKAWSQSGETDWNEYAARLGAQSPLWRARGWTFFAADTVDWA